MSREMLFIILLLVVSPIAFVLMPFLGVLIGAAGLIMLLRGIFLVEER